MIRAPVPLPAGYVSRLGTRGRLMVREDLAAAFEAAGYGPDVDTASVASDLRGRRGLRQLRIEGQRFVVRDFSHGGLARALTGTRFRDPERPFVELALSERLRAAGILTPSVVAARATRASALGWKLAVVTQRVEAARDLGELLGDRRRGDLAPADWRALLSACGELIARLHELGFVHRDLNPNNILLRDASLREGSPELWLLDLDRSRFQGRLSDGSRRDNLRRLYRHVARRDQRHGATLSRADGVRFLRAYALDRGWPDRGWKEDWRAIAASHSRDGLAHRIGWWLEERWGRADDSRHL